MTIKIGKTLVTPYMNRSKHIKENNWNNFKFLSDILSNTFNGNDEAKVSSCLKGSRSPSY